MKQTNAGVMIDAYSFVTVHDHLSGRSFCREYVRRNGKWEFYLYYEVVSA